MEWQVGKLADLPNGTQQNLVSNYHGHPVLSTKRLLLTWACQTWWFPRRRTARAFRAWRWGRSPPSGSGPSGERGTSLRIRPRTWVVIQWYSEMSRQQFPSVNLLLRVGSGVFMKPGFQRIKPSFQRTIKHTKPKIRIFRGKCLIWTRKSSFTRFFGALGKRIRQNSLSASPLHLLISNWVK